MRSCGSIARRAYCHKWQKNLVMSALAQKQTHAVQQRMSAKGQKRTLCGYYSITSSAMEIIPGGTSMPSTRAV